MSPSPPLFFLLPSPPTLSHLPGSQASDFQLSRHHFTSVPFLESFTFFRLLGPPSHIGLLLSPLTPPCWLVPSFLPIQLVLTFRFFGGIFLVLGNFNLVGAFDQFFVKSHLRAWRISIQDPFSWIGEASSISFFDFTGS